ncbi:hypothetical protein ACH5RR_009188 [Cinchona calisaya]|uniref:Protein DETOXIFICATION n=1 Tax=Cinchona calisaya TaxID=153742 RepID=A0ABD3ADL2_9GENT
MGGKEDSSYKGNPLFIFFQDARSVFKMDELGLEIFRIALPAALALTADPIASLIDTAFIGQIGPVELAAVGVSIALFNQVSRIAIFPLVSVTTSFVAEEDTMMTDSPMLKPAEQYLKLRSLGAPAVLLSLAMQGVFRGFKDTKTPLYATAWVSEVLLSPTLYLTVTFCVTLASSLAARLGSTSMAAFQVCLQIWLATSLLADGLAVAGQAILASALAKKDYRRAMVTASRVLQWWESSQTSSHGSTTTRAMHIFKSSNSTAGHLASCRREAVVPPWFAPMKEMPAGW